MYTDHVLVTRVDVALGPRSVSTLGNDTSAPSRLFQQATFQDIHGVRGHGISLVI